MKKIIYVLLNLLTLGLFNLYIAYDMKLYEENAWYSKWYYWFFATLCLIFPVIIMFLVFVMEMNIKVATKLKVKGSNIYKMPYSWILCLIIPLVGWSCFIVMIIYLFIFTNLKMLGSDIC